MRDLACPREQEVLDALQSGRMSELREHLAECSDCADLALVAGFLQHENEIVQQELSGGESKALALDGAGEVHLPSASFLWWKSKLRARREAQEKVLQPVRIAEKVALGAAALGLGGLAWWVWPASVDVHGLWQSLQNSTVALAAGTGAVCATVFALYAVFAKE
jgi:hypothetical protein